MAQAAAAESESHSDRDGESAREGARLVAALTDSLRGYQSGYTEKPDDVVDNRYQVILATPLPQFNTKTADAYAVNDAVNPNQSLYALVCHAGALPRYTLANKLKSLSNPHLMTPLAADTIRLSTLKEDRFVIIYFRPPGKKLSELLVDLGGRVNEHYLQRQIILPLADGLRVLSDFDITHGCVNPDNIWVDKTLILGDCLSAPCGYSQLYYFETLERMQSLPAGKGEGSSAVDFHALGVVALQSLYGAGHFTGLEQPTLIRAILKEGIYSALLRNREPMETFADLFRGLMQPDPNDRWGHAQITGWIEGKRQNAPAIVQRSEAVRPFDFGPNQSMTRRDLAHLFFLDWERIPESMQHSHLLHWVSVSLRNKELAEQINRISRSVIELGSRNEQQLNELLMHVLVLFDPKGPIRIGPLSFHLDGADALAVELFNNKAEKAFQQLAKYVEFGMYNYWLDQQRNDPEYVMPPPVNAAVLRLEKLRVCIRNTGPGFGLERILYELNPELHCMSPMLAGHQARNLGMLLIRLDQIASAQARNNDPVDRHIAAYIASKANIQHEIRLHGLEAIPALATHRTLVALRLLAMAQERSGMVPVPGLTQWLGIRILPCLDHVRSLSLRAKLKSVLMERAASGNLMSLADLIIDSGYAALDGEGFQNARALYHSQKKQIADFREGKLIEQTSTEAGFLIAKLIASLGFLATLLTLMGDK